MKTARFALGALTLALTATVLPAQTGMHGMTPQDLITLKRVAGPVVSPNGKWKTQMLVITGEKDLGIPNTQRRAANAALQWHQTVLGWLARHLKSGS